MGQLYRLDFPNGKSYIGITTKTADERFRQHEGSLRRSKGNGQSVYRAWKKHGAPTLVVLAIVEDSDLYDTEKRAIIAFKTLSPNGYNLTEGGKTAFSKHPDVRAKISAAASAAAKARKRRSHSEETRARISASTKASLATPEARARISAANKARGRASPEVRARMSAAQKGKKLSEETRAKMSVALKAILSSPQSRARMAASQKARRDTEKANKETSPCYTTR